MRVHGCTVHYVNNELDAGPIIAQAAVTVDPGDDEASLSARVLEAEHQLYPHALKLIAEGKVRWTGDNSVSSSTATADDVALLS